MPACFQMPPRAAAGEDFDAGRDEALGELGQARLVADADQGPFDFRGMVMGLSRSNWLRSIRTEVSMKHFLLASKAEPVEPPAPTWRIR